MTADTFSTDGVGLLLMGTGNDNNTWGANANTSDFQVIADAVANTLTNSVTGGTLDLSGAPPPAASSQVRYSRLLFTGTLVADQTVIVPNLNKWWFVENATSGAFVLLFKTTSGTATQIPNGTMKIVRCDGSNGMRRLDADEIGRIEYYGMSSLPNGMLLCDNAAYKRTRLPDLFAKIGTTWGLGVGGDVTTFGTPLLNDTGRFLRSSTGSLAVGTYQANQNLTHTHTGTATGTTGNVSADHTHTQNGTFTSSTESANHTHTFGGGQVASVRNDIANIGVLSDLGATATATESAAHTHNVTISGQTGGISANHTHTFTSAVFTTSSNGGTEARPEAAVMLACIHY